jgi:predicted DNA-binding transcriptional regulator AlpA
MDSTKHTGALLTAKTLGQILSLSKRQVHRLNSLGKIPVPLRIGGAVRWSAEEISAWLAAGAPDRKLWEMTHGKKTEQVQ